MWLSSKADSPALKLDLLQRLIIISQVHIRYLSLDYNWLFWCLTIGSFAQWPKGWNLHSTLDEMVFDHRLLPATAFYWIILPLQQFVIILDLLLAEEVTQE